MIMKGNIYISIYLERDNFVVFRVAACDFLLYITKSIIFPLAVLTRRPLLEAQGSSPESSITKDAQSVICFCRMTENNGRDLCSRNLKKPTNKNLTPPPPPLFFSNRFAILSSHQQ